MEPDNVIEIESQINLLRNSLPDVSDLDEPRRLICQAQNFLQKYIEKTTKPTDWKHVKTVSPSRSTYNLMPAGGE